MRNWRLGRSAILALAVTAGTIGVLAPRAQAYTLLGTKWGIGPNFAQNNAGNIPSPGSATYSIMAAGLGFTGFETHGGATTTNFGALLGGATTAEEVAAINAAFSTWSAVCAFSSLGMVADGGGAGGANGVTGRLGDIRFGALGTGFGGSVLAHAYQPGTETDFGSGWNAGGDVHVNTSWVWVDEANDSSVDNDYDLQTVLLHEIGHSLGLGHSTVVGSVMEAVYAGGRRTLAQDDIDGIRALYGTVPEPTTIAVMGLGVAALLRRRRKA